MALDRTFILAGYTIPCNGTVVAWEFCYRISGLTPVTFYPGIWRITRTTGPNTDYELIQSNSVTYDSLFRPVVMMDARESTSQQQINLLHQQDQLWDCILMLYHRCYTLTLTGSSITTYQLSGNQSSVTASSDVNYNIAIKIHLGKH